MGGANKSLTFDIYGRDKSASKAINGVGKSAQSTGDKFHKAGIAIGVGLAAVGAAAIKFGIDSVKAYADAEAAQGKLAFAFTKFPALADTNQKALQKLNTEMQKKTRFDDDALAAAQANLASFGLTGAQLKQLTPLLADYAAKTGKDVVSASTDLGKAILGNGKALKNVGVDFQDTGDAASNFQQLVDGLGLKVSGFAETDVQTASGKLENMKNRFGEIEEKVGSFLLPVLDELSVKIQDKVLPAIESFMNATTDEEQAAQLDGFMATVGDKLANGAAQWGVKLDNGTAQWGQKLDLGLQQWGDKLAIGWGQISGWFLGSVNTWGASLGNGLNQITGAWNISVAQWGGALANGWTQISTVFNGIGATISSSAVTITAKALGIGQSITDGIRNGLVNGAAQVVSSAIKVATDALNAVKNVLGIHSPSTAFTWVGQMIGAGMVKGIDGSASDVNSSVANLAGVPAVNATKQVSAGLSSGTGGSDRPIYADGIGLIGFIRELANGEARLVWAMGDKANQQVGVRGYVGA